MSHTHIYLTSRSPIALCSILALYSTSSLSHVLIKLPTPPHLQISSPYLANMVSVLQSMTSIPHYSLQTKSLSKYIWDQKLPNKKYILDNETRESCNLIERESVHPALVRRTLKMKFIKDLSEEDSDDSSDTDNEEDEKEETCIDEDPFEDEDVRFMKRTKSLLNKANISDFKLLAKLGKGGFGTVILAKDDRKGLYAMKRIRKDLLLDENAVSNFIIERDILCQYTHPFLLSLKYAFESELRYYLFCEYIYGGDIYKHLKKQRKGFSLEVISFFGAQIICALEFLHKNGYIHCDLKPENILIDKDGYLKLADFGISKHIDDK